MVVIALLFVLIFILPALVTFAAEWLWFQALGYERVIGMRIVVGTLLGVGVGAVAFALLDANLRLALRGAVIGPRLVQLTAGSPIELTQLVRRLARPGVIAIAVLLGLSASGTWLDVLRFLRQVPFGTTDPVFGRDVGYYVFTVPLVADVIRLLTVLTTFGLVASALLYVLRGEVSVRRGHVTVERAARVHLAVLVATLLVLTALRVHFVRIPGLLYSTTGPLVGASYADLHGTLMGLRLAALAAVVGAGLVLWGARGPRLAHATLIAVGLYIGVSLLGVTIYPSIVHRLVVSPNELSKETPQLIRHIAATREAWGLDSVVTRELTGEAGLTEEDIRANSATIDNVRLWDRDPLLQTFGQLQEIRTYYDFRSVDDDRYWIDGRYRQVMLSPRELNAASLPTRTFINERLTFTHGMGIALGPVNQVTSEGLP
ncbi:MAG TPA: UPF0182 family protein, partial [Candidatus Krumholzibacteria bacterium]|nr:UPF0182 family protein [Candidatus Krumholzibacteria bacterium]